MAIDAIQGVNPFIRGLQQLDFGEVGKPKKAKRALKPKEAVRAVERGGPPPPDDWGISELNLNLKSNTSFLREGPLGAKDAVFVKGGRAGCCTNFIA